MTALAEKSRVKAGKPLTTVGQPQVNLLPPEVTAGRRLKVIKRWLGIALVLVLVVCAGGFAYAKLVESKAQADLADAQAETQRLQAEQQKYAEVPRVLGALDDTKIVRAIGMATDVDWWAYYSAITAALPPNVSIDSLVVTSTTALDPAAAPANPLQAESVGRIDFVGRSLTVPDTAAWLDALDAVPGFSDAWTSAANVTENADGTVFYNVTVGVQVTAAAYSHRFDIAEPGQEN